MRMMSEKEYEKRVKNTLDFLTTRTQFDLYFVHKQISVQKSVQNFTSDIFQDFLPRKLAVT